MSGPDEERERLEALAALQVLDSAPEAEFDLITGLAVRLFGVPTALLTLIDAERQWCKSRQGFDAQDIAREIAFCDHTIRSGELFEITDAAADPRFAANPLVSGPARVRYYAGAPLTLKSGHRIGALCLLDTKTRPALTDNQRAILRDMARLAVVQLELRQLRRSAQLSDMVAAATPDAIICADKDGIIIRWNAGAERLFGHAAAEAIGAPLEIIIPPHLHATHGRRMTRLLQADQKKQIEPTIELPALHRDGSTLAIELSLAAWKNDDGGRVGFAAIVRDISARKALEAERAETQRFLDSVIENVPAMLFVKDARTCEYLLWNEAGERTTGLSRRQVVGRTDEQLFPGEGPAYMKRDEVTLRTGIPHCHESRFTRGDGSRRCLRTHRVMVPDAEGEPRYLLGISEDITEWRDAQERLAFLAGHDPLTLLENRASLTARIEAALERQEEIALLTVDIDRFKAVNDGHGHFAGDLLLTAFGRMLREALGGEGTAARIGGDEFVVLLVGSGAERRAARVAGSILEKVRQPVDLGHLQLQVGLSIGVAIASDHGRQADDLLKGADVALLRAKAAGRGCFRFFDSGMDQAAQERRRIETHLGQAIADDQIRLVYQPLACVETGRVIGFEALARWSDPEIGEVRPDLFIPIAEESGHVVALGRRLLRAAVAEAARWTPKLGISVNLSPIQVRDPGFYDEVAALLAEHELSPGRLDLEVTEGIMINETDPAIATLKRLKALGVGITMDDFGTGYSSLSYFRMFPFDKVKIDQSFVSDMGRSREALAIVQAVIGVARGLGLRVVAEGVETSDQFDSLRAEGCTLVQGYLLGKPAPIEAFEGVVIERAPSYSAREAKVA